MNRCALVPVLARDPVTNMANRVSALTMLVSRASHCSKRLFAD
jgi:hypothetical protein